MTTSIVKGHLDINALLAFIFGIIFVSVMLGFARFVPNPSGFSLWVFVVVTSLAGAGVGAVIPGMLNIDFPYVRAGGALAIFALIFFNKPSLEGYVAKLEPPQYSPLPVILEYLRKVDEKKLDEAWTSLDSESKETVAHDHAAFLSSYQGGRFVLGAVVSRVPIGSAEQRSPNGYPLGIYRYQSFRTKFESNKCHLETVSVRGGSDLVWRVFDHMISPVPIPCLG